MKNFFLGLFIPCLTVIIFCTQVQAVDINHGENVFTANCSACHSGGENVIIYEKNLRKDALSKNEMDNVKSITYQVTNGKNAMPAFGGRLSDNDIEDVASFVLSQSEKGWE
uniref:Cytochrome c6 n=1 Tax=Coccophora langsdorfii TaxID=74099 RepID=A0A1L2F1R1_9PHAE|nr:PetJ [Coccophora langsdorfii]ANS72284.1 PetJ [Coccophora langsdorfii]